MHNKILYSLTKTTVVTSFFLTQSHYNHRLLQMQFQNKKNYYVFSLKILCFCLENITLFCVKLHIFILLHILLKKDLQAAVFLTLCVQRTKKTLPSCCSEFDTAYAIIQPKIHNNTIIYCHTPDNNKRNIKIKRLHQS